jgi:hypothetical protein
MEFDEKYIETVVNRTYPGLTMYIRDANLPEIISEKYKKGIIIREKAFCDASSRVMGMVTTHRYAILSNHMANLSEFEHGTKWGLHVANRDSRFKVLENYEYRGKRIILLLHIPDDDSWKVFREIEIRIDNELVTSCIEKLKNKLEADPAPDLAKIDWIERCAFPIGMDDDGNLFDLE